MAEVNVADFEASTLTRQATRAKCRKATPVGQTRQRIDLIHELRELRSSEELLDRCDDRTNIDQRLRRDRLDVLSCHPFTDDAFHTAEADANLILDQFTDAAYPAVSEVVLVIQAVARLLLNQVQHVRDRRKHFTATQYVLVIFWVVEQWLAFAVDGTFQAEKGSELADLFAKFTIDLVSAHAAEVVTTALKKRVSEVRLGGLNRRWLSGAGTFVNFDESFVLGWRYIALLVPLTFEEVEVRNEAIQETGSVLFVVAERTQHGEDSKAAFAGHAGAGGDILAWLVLYIELHPFAAVGMNGALDELVLGEVAKAEALTRLEDHSRAADELANYDTLGAVNDERSLVGHDWEVTHEHGLFFNLACIAIHEPRADEYRRAVGHVLFLALLHREFWRRAQVFIERVEFKLKLKRFREVLNGANVAEGIRKPFIEEPLEALTLYGNEVGEL